MQFQYHDGGRLAAGYKGDAGDCVTRAIAIATGKEYQEVYKTLSENIIGYAYQRRTKTAKLIQRMQHHRTPRNGVFDEIYKEYLASIGWTWTPTMKIGSGCKVHLRADELPSGRLIVRLSKHLCAVIDGVIYDTYDPSREGTRCVYGYFTTRASLI